MRLLFCLQRLIAFGLAIFLLAAGCSSRPAVQSASTSPTQATRSQAEPSRVQFTDVTKAAGIAFRHTNGASGLRLMPETNGSGVAFLDYDNDGYQDLFFVNSRNWTPTEFQAGRQTIAPDLRKFAPAKPPQRTPAISTLYHNNGDGTFSDVTKSSGLSLTTYGMGAAVGDYDNDGRVDLYITAYPRNYLFHNEGNGRFREVAAQAGVQSEGWGMCGAWLDYDRDGWLDLFAGRYIQWTPATDVYQTSKGLKSYSNPTAYEGQTSRLFRNLGNGKFQDVSNSAGISANLKASGAETFNGKAMGVAVCDYNNDGWPDMIVANDTMRNFLFENKGDGTFREVAQQVGIAHDRFGRARAGMGIDTADLDHSNRDSVIIGNFSREMLGLYYNTGQGTFVDAAPDSEVGRVSENFLTFGCLFFDFDNDGWSDILAANGHVQPDIAKLGTQETYAQRPLLFRNESHSGLRFREIGLSSGAALRRPIVARGLAYADYDLDGDLDVVITANGGPAHLWRNEGGNANQSIRLILRGTKSNRSAIGALIKVKTGADVLRLWVRSGSSFLSQSELPVTLGMGHNQAADGIAIFWPSGAKTKLENIATNQMVTVEEGKGVILQKPFPTKK